MEMQQMIERFPDGQEKMRAEMNAKLGAFRDKLDADMGKTDAETKPSKQQRKQFQTS
jgi:hypothetical protein